MAEKSSVNVSVEEIERDVNRLFERLKLPPISSSSGSQNGGSKTNTTKEEESSTRSSPSEQVASHQVTDFCGEKTTRKESEMFGAVDSLFKGKKGAFSILLVVIFFMTIIGYAGLKIQEFLNLSHMAMDKKEEQQRVDMELEKAKAKLLIAEMEAKAEQLKKQKEIKVVPEFTDVRMVDCSNLHLKKVNLASASTIQVNTGENLKFTSGCVAVEVHSPINRLDGYNYIIEKPLSEDEVEYCGPAIDRNDNDSRCKTFFDRRRGLRLVIVIKNGGYLKIST